MGMGYANPTPQVGDRHVVMSGWGQVLSFRHLATMSAAQGEAAETAGKPTYAALTAGLRLTAVVLGIVAG
jgi:hypothetical protein